MAELARFPPRPLYPDHPCRVGAASLAELDEETLPVVDPEDERRVLGLFSREDLFTARVVALQDELERDRTLRVSIPSLRIHRGPLARPTRETRSREESRSPAPAAEDAADGPGRAPPPDGPQRGT